ncbi:anoctamin-8-like, partial [Tropilaelaps mercedesae]
GDVFLAAGRLIGRRIAVSKQLFQESGPRFLENFWNRSHSSQAECDVVLTLPSSTDQILVEWLLNTFEERLPQIKVRLTHHRFSKFLMLICTADMPELLKGAEQLHMRKKVKAEFGGGFKEFCCDDPYGIWEEQDVDHFLSTQERQEIIMFYINSMRTEAKDAVRGKLLLEGQSLIQRLRKERIIDQIYPLHEAEPLRELKSTWVNRFFSPQPLDDIAAYFGVKIAMYFGWLGHYTVALAFPALVGLCIWIFCYGKDQRREDLCFILFALLNIIWATLFLESWKRRSSELAHHWGSLDSSSEMLNEPRPLFKLLMLLLRHLDGQESDWSVIASIKFDVGHVASTTHHTDVTVLTRGLILWALRAQPRRAPDWPSGHDAGEFGPGSLRSAPIF